MTLSRPALAASNDRQRGDGDGEVEQGDGKGQHVMPVPPDVAVAQLFIDCFRISFPVLSVWQSGPAPSASEGMSSAAESPSGVVGKSSETKFPESNFGFRFMRRLHRMRLLANHVSADRRQHLAFAILVTSG
jgi:hypothetical protein